LDQDQKEEQEEEEDGGDTSSLAHRLSVCRGLILQSVKNEFLSLVLERSSRLERDAAKHKPRLVIDRLLANPNVSINGSGGDDKDEESVPTDASTSASPSSSSITNSIFHQSYRQLAELPVHWLLAPRPSGGNPHTTFDVKLRGEHVVGEGGPYRQYFTDVCRELQTTQEDIGVAVVGVGSAGSASASSSSSSLLSDEKSKDDANSKEPTAAPAKAVVLPLFVQCANKQVGVGDNRDKFVPRPSSRAPPMLELYAFLGRIMGVALRTGILMPLDLPSFFWKQMVAEQPNRKDLEGIDASFVNGVLAKIDELPDTPEGRQAFLEHFGEGTLRWCTMLSDQTLVELKPGGKDLAVSFADRLEWAALAERVRLNECREQVRAIKRGLCELVPEAVLMLYSWSELERRICGKPFIDIDLLRRHTEYSGVSATAPHVQWFWQVLHEFSQDERRKFIKFVWAQERLPASDEEFHQGGQRVRMLIKSAPLKNNQRADDRFPTSDTCFMNVQLPAYSSLEVMRQKLSTVINITAGMDGDDDPALAGDELSSPHFDEQDDLGGEYSEGEEDDDELQEYGVEF